MDKNSIGFVKTGWEELGREAAEFALAAMTECGFKTEGDSLVSVNFRPKEWFGWNRTLSNEAKGGETLGYMSSPGSFLKDVYVKERGDSVREFSTLVHEMTHVYQPLETYDRDAPYETARHEVEAVAVQVALEVPAPCRDIYFDLIRRDDARGKLSKRRVDINAEMAKSLAKFEWWTSKVAFFFQCLRTVLA